MTLPVYGALPQPTNPGKDYSMTTRYNPEEFELGEDITEQFEAPKRSRSGIVVSVRLEPDDADRLTELAEATGRTVSQVARAAIHDYLGGPIGVKRVSFGSSTPYVVQSSIPGWGTAAYRYVDVIEEPLAPGLTNRRLDTTSASLLNSLGRSERV